MQLETKEAPLLKRSSSKSYYFAKPELDIYVDFLNVIECIFRERKVKLKRIFFFPPCYLLPTNQIGRSTKTNKGIELNRVVLLQLAPGYEKYESRNKRRRCCCCRVH